MAQIGHGLLLIVVGRVLILGRFDEAGINDDFWLESVGAGRFRLDARGRARRRGQGLGVRDRPEIPSPSVVD